jgi:hypothetical protein
MQKIKSKPGLTNFFAACPSEIQWYFEHLPKLVDAFPLDVALAYMFARIETAQRMSIYCGVTKLHSCESALAWQAVSGHWMTRADFKSKFEVIYGKALPDTVTSLAVYAEGVRDRVMHGKATTDDDRRNAIAHLLQYAVDFNAFVITCNGPPPFADLRGFKGAAKGLPKPTSRWVLKGMGFPV